MVFAASNPVCGADTILPPNVARLSARNAEATRHPRVPVTTGGVSR
jgi:hypothetical protein